MGKNYLEELNKPQREAVKYCDGPLLVIAGAGSGKTRVLTYKIVHMLVNDYEPWRILALTFTNKAANEMTDRIKAMVGEKTAARLWMGTFHSIFARILRAHAEKLGFKSNFTIYDTADSKSLIKSIIRFMDLDDKVYKPSMVQNIISWAKNRLISPEMYSANSELLQLDRHAKRPLLHEIYRMYRARCLEANAMDFDDLLYYTNLLFRDYPDVLRHYQEFFRYVLVDEYQDTNFAQHLIVKSLTAESGNLCVVGDDAQSIYSFRGANIGNIINLRQQYANLKTIKLEQNYRSTQNIINAANSLIDKNKNQIKKTIFSENDPGERISVIKCYSDFDEAGTIASKISQLRMTTHDSFSDFAILYRTNAQSRVLEESLRKRNIPYRIYGSVSFYQRKEIKDAVAYLRLAVNPSDDEAFRRIVNYPARGIGETTVNNLVAGAMNSQVSLMEACSDIRRYAPEVKPAGATKLMAFAGMIRNFAEMVSENQYADRVVDEILRRSGLMELFTHDRTPENISRLENLQELKSAVKEFVDNTLETDGDTVPTLSAFLQLVSLSTDQDESGNDDDHVSLMTVHAAKGLEFNNVLIVGVEDDLFPSMMAKNSLNEVEEERRLLYVAITRARNHCVISYASSRFRNGMTTASRPSPFLGDIDPKYLKMLNTGSKSSSFSDSYTDSYSRTTTGSFRQRPAERTPVFTPAPTTRTAPQPSSGNFTVHDVSELTVGMTIEHSRFGKGTINAINTEMSDPRITVHFETEGDKTLILKWAKFNIL
ncbi:MAG: UvrD-helicase domain-containing protein [Muribaculaceae bacterium]|nr:UvrD-helicase domain-containing protein [Muribaculaceae bacterium]